MPQASKITLHSASVHPSADAFGSCDVLPADVLPAMLQCDIMRPKIMKATFYTTNGCLQWAWTEKVVEPTPFLSPPEKTVLPKMMENLQNVEDIVERARWSAWTLSGEFSKVLPPDLPHQRPCKFSPASPHNEIHAVTHGFAVRFRGRHVLSRFPAEILTNMCANACGCEGCSCLHHLVANCVLRSVRYFLACPNCAYHKVIRHTRQ